MSVEEGPKMQERAIKAEAENAKLRRVVDAARGAIRYIDADVEDECCCVGCQTCRQLRTALAELDKEDER